MVSPFTAALILFGLWGLFFLIIPMVFIGSLIKIKGEGDKFRSVIGRTIAAGIVFFVTGAIALIVLIGIVIGPHPRDPDDFLSFYEFMFLLIGVLLFGFFGYLGSVHICERFINPLSLKFWIGERGEGMTRRDL